jgi:hypothetical protein
VSATFALLVLLTTGVVMKRARSPRSSESAPRPSLWSRTLSVRNLILTTVVTVLVSLGVTALWHSVSTRTLRGDGVNVSVISNPDKVPAFGPPLEAILPRHASTDGSPGSACSGFHQWAHERGGIDAGSTRLQVIVRGTDESQVVISAMRVRVDKKQPPLRGIPVRCNTAGTLSQRRVGINLDSARPVVRYTSSDGRAFGFTVSKGEVESFLVTARTRTAWVRWQLLLDVVVAGQPHSVRVGEYQTTPAPSGPVWDWDYADHWTTGQATVPAGEALEPLGAS